MAQGRNVCGTISGPYERQRDRQRQQADLIPKISFPDKLSGRTEAASICLTVPVVPELSQPISTRQDVRNVQSRVEPVGLFESKRGATLAVSEQPSGREVPDRGQHPQLA